LSTNTSATGGFIGDVSAGPPSGEDFTAGVQQMIAALSGLDGSLVRPRWQPMPPSQPAADVTWAALGLTRTEADEYPYIAHDGVTQWPGLPGPGVDRMQRHVTLSMRATFYGPGAEDAAGAVRDGAYVAQNMEPLIALGMKLRTVHDLERAPEFINQQWIDRVDLAIDFRAQIERVYPILNLIGAKVVLQADTGMTTTVSVEPPPP
jgi:hypothetical protein